MKATTEVGSHYGNYIGPRPLVLPILVASINSIKGRPYNFHMRVLSSYYCTAVVAFIGGIALLRGYAVISGFDCIVYSVLRTTSGGSSTAFRPLGSAISLPCSSSYRGIVPANRAGISRFFGKTTYLVQSHYRVVCSGIPGSNLGGKLDRNTDRSLPTIRIS